MRTTNVIGAVSIIVFAMAGMIWFALELAPPRLGFEDTDSPAVSLRFLREHSIIWAQAGIALLVMAVTLIIGTLAVADVLARRSSPLVVRSVTAFGLLSAVGFFLHGVMRSSVESLLYIDSLDTAWGEAAYTAVQMVGIHGFAQGGIFALCLWAVGVSLVGGRTRAIPVALAALGVIPAFRIIALILGPLGAADALPDALWVMSIGAIPGTLLWCLLLGLVLVRRAAATSTTTKMEGSG